MKKPLDLTQKQKKAIDSFQKALYRLKANGIRICGMDHDILYATQKAIDLNGGDIVDGHKYCAVAEANRSLWSKTDSVGEFDTKGIYDDSGGF